MAVRMKHHLGNVTRELRWEPVPYRVRAHAGDTPVVDTTGAVLVWEPRRIVPVFGVPTQDLRVATAPLDPQPAPPDPDALPLMLGPTHFGPHTTPGTHVRLAVGAGVDGFLPDDQDLAGILLVDFAGFDRWQVEDEELVGHPHDLFKRIDVMASGRLVEIRLDGVTLAISRRSRMLLETHLPPRWYLPVDDVRMDLLEPSNTRSTCAYKGHASYLSVIGGERDIAWFYPEPLADAEPVRGHVCFWNERTDQYLDGVLQPRPVTPWSRPDEQRGADPARLEFG